MSNIELPQDLVEKMKDAMKNVSGDPDWINIAFTNAVSAALRVALEDERVLGDPSVPEMRETSAWTEQAMGLIKQIFANRRARLLKPKTPEERVTIRPTHTIGYAIQMDGRDVHEEICENDAEIYRLGLIAKLKADQEAQS